MKRFLPQYNFLPRVREKDDAYYPYLSDEAMENLKWVAASYSDVLPVYTPGPERLMKGDRIRITRRGPQGGDGLCGELHVCAAALCRTRAI